MPINCQLICISVISDVHFSPNLTKSLQIVRLCRIFTNPFLKYNSMTCFSVFFYIISYFFYFSYFWLHGGTNFLFLKYILWQAFRVERNERSSEYWRAETFLRSKNSSRMVKCSLSLKQIFLISMLSQSQTSQKYI